MLPASVPNRLESVRRVLLLGSAEAEHPADIPADQLHFVRIQPQRQIGQEAQHFGHAVFVIPHCASKRNRITRNQANPS